MAAEVFKLISYIILSCILIMSICYGIVLVILTAIIAKQRKEKEHESRRVFKSDSKV